MRRAGRRADGKRSACAQGRFRPGRAGSEDHAGSDQAARDRKPVEDRPPGRGRPGRPADASRAGRPSWRRHRPRTSTPWSSATCAACRSRWRPASRPAAGPGTSACSATIRCATASVAACSRRSGSTSIWGRTTSPPAATSARSGRTARSPTGAPDGSAPRYAGVSWTGCERSAWTASNCSSSRSGTTGSCSCCAAAGSGRRSTTPTPDARACRRSSPWRGTRRRSARRRCSGTSSSAPRRSSPTSIPPT